MPATTNQTVTFEKGQMTGRFEMGSTIVLIYEAPMLGSEVYVQPGEKVSLG
jgi:phosphatidylserine decarboxylase